MSETKLSLSGRPRDNSPSMVYNGWEFRKAVLDGEEMGRQIANDVFTNSFKQEQT